MQLRLFRIRPPPVSSITVLFNDANGHGVQQSISSTDFSPVTVTVPAHTPFTIIYGASDPDGVHSLCLTYDRQSVSDGFSSTTHADCAVLTFGRDCPQGSRLAPTVDFRWTTQTVEYDFTAIAGDYNGNDATTPKLIIRKGE